MSEQLGVLGVGHLASYTLAGLRNAGDSRPVLLSPRNRERALSLAVEHGCEVAVDNEMVVDRTRLILLSVRPEQVNELLQNLTFTSEHLLISCVAGMSLSEIAPLVSPARVIRAMPLACAEVGEGAIALFPDHPEVRQLMAQMGCVIPFEDEDSYEVASVAACMNGWMYAFFEQLTDWYVGQGIESTRARELVLHSVSGATGLALARPELALGVISDSIATEGTFTKLGLDLLQAQDSFGSWQQACERVAKALKS
ncbi:MAG: NAD(P)-binding domain-containing protein [Motiliproteus sp.]